LLNQKDAAKGGHGRMPAAMMGDSASESDDIGQQLRRERRMN